MSALPAEVIPKPANSTAKRQSFWRRLARRLDALVAYPIRHAISERELRRVDDDIKRCRQLMLNTPRNRGSEILAHVPMHNAVRWLRVR
jgi:hypothetical protein